MKASSLINHSQGDASENDVESALADKQEEEEDEDEDDEEEGRR